MNTKILLLVLFLPVMCFSQSYDRMVKQNSFYNYFMIYPFPSNTYDHTVFYKFSDTVTIDTLSCMKLMVSADTTLGWDFTGAYFYEDTINEKVYLLDNDTIGLLYDFSINTGDTVFVYNPIQGGITMPLVVESTDSVFYDGKYHKTLLFDNNYWIEGIGDLYGILYPGSMLTGSTEQLVCFYLDMQIEYLNPAYSNCFYSTAGIDEYAPESGLLSVYPNPAGEKFTAHYEVESVCSEMFLVIHNVMGKEVSRNRVNECIGDVELSSPSETGTYYVYIESCGQYIAIDKIVVTR